MPPSPTRLILLADAITSPLTGIGRYAFEIARHMNAEYAADCLRMLGHFGWRSTQDVLAVGAQPTTPDDRQSLQTPSAASLTTNLRFARVRLRLAENSLVSAGYTRLRHILGSRTLEKLSGDWLVHSPNYFAPVSRHRTVVTVHDLSVLVHPEWHPSQRVRRVTAMLDHTVRAAHHIIVDADATRRELLAHYGLTENLVTSVPLGVDTAKWFPLADECAHGGSLPRLPESVAHLKQYVLCVATFEPRKNIVRLLAAYDGLPTAFKRQYPLVLAGAPGWQSDKIEDAIGRATRSGWLVVLGYLPDELLAAVYRRATVFVYPSLYEGFGLPILEAMASGVPVITSNISSMPEVAAGQALLADPFDEHDIRRCIERATTDEAWRDRARIGGLLVARGRPWDRCAALTRAVYRQVLSQH